MHVEEIKPSYSCHYKLGPFGGKIRTLLLSQSSTVIIHSLLIAPHFIYPEGMGGSSQSPFRESYLGSLA